jgi:hypothetical protein
MKDVKNMMASVVTQAATRCNDVAKQIHKQAQPAKGAKKNG